MPDKTVLLFPIGLVLVAAGLLLRIFGYLPQDSGAMSGLVAAGVVCIVIAALRQWRFDRLPVSDERTRKIGAYGITCSWLLTIIWLCAIFWVTDLGLVELRPQAVAFITMFLMIISARVFQWHLFRKGDIE